jgi:hypothetical protein
VPHAPPPCTTWVPWMNSKFLHATFDAWMELSLQARTLCSSAACSDSQLSNLTPLPPEPSRLQ